MKCFRCQHEAPADAGFCPQCGARLTGACARCGAENAPDHKFCMQCGQPLAAAAAQARDAGRFGSPLAYTPKHLTEKILTSKSALEGERKQVTVLFCDIVESTRLAESLDLEVMHRLMDETLQLMAEAVHRYQGTVNQFLGDGVMALFGAPAAVEDHALRGVQAALAIRETINSYSERLKRERSIEIQLRMGLNTGLVVVGLIGDDLRMDYTAIGDTTHLAARMQTLAEPGTIVVTEATHRLVAGYVEAEPLGPVAVRGRSEPVEVYRVVARRRAQSRLELSAERGLTPLVGREPELSVLHDRLARARAGHGQVIGIVGEPGAGKSRVLYEFRKSLESERLTWLAGHCVAYGQTTPYLPILEILKATFEIEDGDNPLQIQDKLRQGLRVIDPGLEAAFPFLRELFGLSVEDDQVQELPPKDKRQKIFEAVRALMAAESQRRPMVVIVEDLHWIDRTSEDLIGFLIDSVPAMSLLFLMTHRPGYTVRSADRTYYTQIALDLLNESEAEAMVAGLLESRQLPPDVLSVIWEKTDGNPLFVEEIMRSLSERRLLVRRGGGVQWTHDTPVEIPVTVQDIVRARIDGLEDPVKRTVQTAAVIGREFGLRLLAGIAERRAELDRHLDTLTHLELVHEKRVFPEVEYIFKHAVTQEVVYETLLLQRRKELHRRIGRAIEELYAGRVDEQAAILAYHYTRGEDREKMVQYAVLAGDRAGRLYANADARSYYQQALAIVRTHPAPPEGERAEIDIAVKLAGVGINRQDIEQDLGNLERARGLAEALDDAPRLARVLYWLGRLHYMLGASHEAALAYATRSLEIADRLGDESLAAPSVNLIGRVYWSQTDLIRASLMLERSVGQMTSLGNKTEAATAAGAAAFVFGCMGEFDRAMHYADRGVELAREARDLSAEAAAWQNRAFVLEHRGELGRALGEYAEARRLAEQVGDRFRVYIINVLEVRAHVLAGDPRGGWVLVEAAQAFAEQTRTRFLLASLKMGLASCLLALGDAGAAVSPCREAIELAEQAGEKFLRALAGRVLAEVSVSLDPSPASVPAAVASLEESAAILEDIGARPEQARCYVVLAGLVRLQGDSDRADELLRRARALFGVMDLRWDLNRLDEASG